MHAHAHTKVAEFPILLLSVSDVTGISIEAAAAGPSDGQLSPFPVSPLSALTRPGMGPRARIPNTQNALEAGWG